MMLRMEQTLRHWVKKGLQKTMGMENYWKFMFFMVHGYRLNLNDPRSLSEKLQWIKLYCNLEPLAPLANKYLVRQFVKTRISQDYLIGRVGVYDAFDHIPFDDLQERFVLKATHGSDWNIIVKDEKNLD